MYQILKNLELKLRELCKEQLRKLNFHEFSIISVVKDLVTVKIT